MYWNENSEILLGESSALEKIKKHERVAMDEKRLKVVLTVLEAAKPKYPETKQFIDNTMKEECQKEDICGWGNFFYKSRSKDLAQKNIFWFAVSILRDIVLG